MIHFLYNLLSWPAKSLIHVKQSLRIVYVRCNGPPHPLTIDSTHRELIESLFLFDGSLCTL